MNSVVEDTLNKLKQCDDFHNRCDCLLEHSEITYLLDYIQQKENIIKELRDKVSAKNDEITLLKSKQSDIKINAENKLKEKDKEIKELKKQTRELKKKKQIRELKKKKQIKELKKKKQIKELKKRK